ncbi:MAG: hypothetical protein P0S96_00315 [Simkaniaceae bacterium]|nr:hypothetical protein [Candidatus Sacchlamyda saccharinae]
MNIKLAAILTLFIPATALLAEAPNLEEVVPQQETATDPNTCRYVGIGVGVPHLDLNLGVRKKWENNGIDIGINGETSSSIQKEKGDTSQVLGYVNYLLFPNSSSDASFYAGVGGSAGMKMAHFSDEDYEFVGEGNVLVGRSFANKQFVQAKVGIPVEYDAEKKWINRIEDADPSITVSYGIGF